MRSSEFIFENMRIEATRLNGGCDVFTIRSASELSRRIDEFTCLRGMLYWDGTLDVWDANMATHNAYENTFGDQGARRLMFNPGGVEYNAMDFEDEEAARSALFDIPMIRRLYGEDMKLTSNEI